MTQNANRKTPQAPPWAGDFYGRSRICRHYLCVGFLLALASLAFAAESLTWRADQNRVDADIRALALPKLLERIATTTGWQVYVDPAASHTASTKFTNLPVNDALGRLLGDLNFALIPQTNASARLLVFRTSLKDATQLVQPDPSAKPADANAKRVPNELIVTLKPGGNIDELARALGAKVVGRIDGLNTYRLQFEDEAATDTARAQLQSHPQVASVENNYSVDRPAPGASLLAGAAAPPQLKMRAPGDSGHIIVGLIDTPIQSLCGNFDSFLLPAMSVAGEAQPNPNWPTHATEMASIILASVQAATGGSTSVQILPVDVYGNNPNTTTFEVALGIYRAVNAGANPINLSLGGNAESEFLHSVIQQARQQGVLFLAAAGNAPVTTPTYPAAYPEVVAVTAGDRQGNIADYANRGSFVSVVAPGDRVICYNGQQYRVRGTSVAVADTSGTTAGSADSQRRGSSEVEAVFRAGLSVKPASNP